MKNKILMIVTFLILFTVFGFAQTGTYTTNGYFYMPSYGETGIDAFNEFNTYLQYADTQIEYNKNHLTADDLTDNTLDDLSDVNTATVTNRYVLVADGVDFESRLLVETDISDLGTYLEDITAESILDLSDTPVAFSSGKFLKSGADAVTFASITETDISDLGSYIESVADDTTPELGGDLDSKDKNITGIGRASFTQEYDNSSKSASFTIDFDTDQKQKVTLTANTMTLTLDTTSVGVANYLLKIVNGGLATLTWAAETGSVYWPGGTEPTLTSSGTDIVTFYFDGTNWYGGSMLDFK